MTVHSSNFPTVVLFSVFQVVAVTIGWFLTILERDWEATQQFMGHVGPAIFLVALGAAAIFLHDKMRVLITYEALLAAFAGAAYVLADTFVMHPPWGVFDGAGHAEQEHVAIMGLVFILGVSGLVLIPRFPGTPPSAAHFIIGISVAAFVFGNHHQHTVAGTVAHMATMLFLGVAALFRLLERYIEYGVAMIVTGYVFFASQAGFAYFVDTVDNSPGAWVALWATFGFTSATVYIALSPKPQVPAE